jgi:hypothetical protein
MLMKAMKVIFVLLIVGGVIVTVANFVAKDLNAYDHISKFGMYLNPGDEESCPGEPRNCYVVYIFPDK